MDYSKFKFITTSVFVFFAVTSNQSFADNQKKKHRKPPKAAFEACLNLSESSPCQVETPRGTLQGSCFNHPKRDKLVCRPAEHEKRKAMKKKRRELKEQRDEAEISQED